MLTHEPTAVLGALGELVRQIVPMLLLFGVINWTDPQIAGVFMVVSAAIKVLEVVLTRSQVVPAVIADRQMEIAKASPVTRPTEQIIQEAKESV